MEKTASDLEEIQVNNASFKRVDPAVFQEPDRLDQYEQPLWEGSIVYDEPVLLFAEGDESPAGKLLYEPTRILSVKSYLFRTIYAEGADNSNGPVKPTNRPIRWNRQPYRHFC
jgi:hypothetical protein